MTPFPTSALPDYERLAADFDRYLPLIEPVTWALLEHLPALPEGSRVLDVACGTGEPGLSLARRSPGVQLLGVDATAGMIEVARAKAARGHLSNVRFEVMPAETLACADGSMDAVLSRFGLLMFGDVAASAREMARVLRVGGHFSVAVWDDAGRNTLVNAVFAALRPRVPPAMVTFFDRLGEIAAGERLREAGLTGAQSKLFTWHYEFSSQEVFWQFVSGPGMFTGHFGVLGEADKEQVRVEVATSLLPYRQEDGGYRIPHTCRLWWGQR